MSSRSVAAASSARTRGSASASGTTASSRRAATSPRGRSSGCCRRTASSRPWSCPGSPACSSGATRPRASSRPGLGAAGRSSSTRPCTRTPEPPVTTTIPRATTPGARRRRRRRAVVPVLVLLFLGILALGGWAWWRGVLAALPLREHCTATALGQSTELDPEQAGNAAIIAAVAVRRGLPGRAATIGIATAMQESKLRNLPGGDRDSIGLFQQRPSQGWGTPAQVRDPVYASNAFYDVLVKIEGYEDLPITKAAQKVQRSAFPSAYADHEPEARILASALTGYSPAGLSCVLPELRSLPAQATDAGGFTPRTRAVARAA